MNTIQLNQVMYNFPQTSKIFLGTLPIDKLHKKVSYPSCLIINNQPSNKYGEHWVAIYFDTHQKATFFDSYGKSSSFYKLRTFIKKNSKSYTENKKQLQSISNHCGYYCVLFLIFKSLGYSLKQFLKNFNSPVNNDYMISKYLKKF